MRTATYSNVIVEYPDAVVFAHDNNRIIVHTSDDATVGAKITIGGQIVRYNGVSKSAMFDVSKLIRISANDTMNVSIQVLKNGTAVGVVNTTFKRCQGRTLADRLHGSATTIIATDDTTSVQIFSPSAGTASVEQTTIQLTSGINTINIGRSNAILVTYASPVKLGDIFGATESNFASINIERRCVPDRGAVVRYKDTDGCERMVVGMITEQTNTVEDYAYKSRSGLFDTPKRLVLSEGSQLTIFVENVPPKSHIEDIIYSDSVTIEGVGGISVEGVPSLKSLQRVNDNFNDVELTFDIR